MAMVEETFRAKSLGEAFEKDVVGTVRELAGDLRRGLPSELLELGEMVKEHWQRLLAELQEGLPEQLAERAAAGEAIQVQELPKALADKLSRAAQWLWLDRIIFHLLTHTSELRESTWVGLERHPKGDRLIQLWSDADPKAGDMRTATFPERARRYRMSAVMPHGSAPKSQKALQARLVEDVRRAVAGLRAGMGAQLPVSAPELYAEVQNQFERLAVAWMESLSEEDRRRLDAGERVPVHELSGRAQETLLSLAYKSYNAQAHSCQVPGGFFRSWQCHYILRASIRELAEVDWLRSVVARIAVPPEWASHLAECQITFEVREERTGQPGVKLERQGTFIVMSSHGISAESSGDPEELKAVDS
jgi:hypothetical protein